MEEHRLINDGGMDTTAADELHTFANQMSTLADELERIEREAAADEITYRIRDGSVVIIELAYVMSE